MTTALMVGLGGATGALLRWQFAQRIPWDRQSLPWATLFANLMGAFLLGLLVTYLMRLEPQGGPLRGLLLFGFSGALTTFSTLVWELVVLTENGAWQSALLYVALSLGLGLSLCVLGLALGRAWMGV